MTRSSRPTPPTAVGEPGYPTLRDAPRATVDGTAIGEPGYTTV
jgi:hypothetical protein